MENNVFVNRCSPSCRACASPSCLSLSECSCRTGTICEACTFRFGLQDAVLAANREASPSDAAGELLEESIFAGPHPIDALMTWYYCSANDPFQDGRAPNRSGNGKRYRDRIAYSWMGYKKSSQQPFDIRQTLSNREVYECALAVSYQLKFRMGLSQDDCDGQEGNMRERIVLCFEPGLSFIVAFLGVLIAGLIPVPIYPVQPRAMHENPGDSHVARVAKDCGARFALTSYAYYTLVTTSKLANAILSAKGGAWDGNLRWVPVSISRLRRVHRDVIGGMACMSGADDGCIMRNGLLRVLHARYRLDDVAFLQYTSGSTMHPKAVVVTHRALMHNIAQLLCIMAPVSSESCEVSWLPQYHDMGLIGAVLVRLCILGGRCVLFDPLLFVRMPLSWPIAMSQYGATHTGGPDFAYGLISRRERERRIAEQVDSAQRKRDPPYYDLSKLHFALVGGERVRESTMRSVLDTFGECGLRSEALFPSYGLAESCVYVSHQRGLIVESVGDSEATDDDAPLGVVQEKISVSESPPALEDPPMALSRRVVSVGQPVDGFGVEILIVRTDTEGEVVRDDVGRVQLAADGSVGEIWLHSSSCAAGYWDHYRQQHQGHINTVADTFSGFLGDGHNDRRFLRTGDFGLIRSGGGTRRLFIVGRLKDVIVVRGKNIYPEDVEEIIADGHVHDRYRVRRLAAIAVQVPGHIDVALSGEGPSETVEELAIIVETDICTLKTPNATLLRESFQNHAAHIRYRVLASLNVSVAIVLFVKRNSIPRTTSGKVKRRAASAAVNDVLMRLRSSESFIPERNDPLGILHTAPPLSAFGAIKRDCPQAPQPSHRRPFEPLLVCVQLRREGRESISNADVVNAAARCIMDVIGSLHGIAQPTSGIRDGALDDWASCQHALPAAVLRMHLRDCGLDSSQLISLQSTINTSGVLVSEVDVIGTVLGGGSVFSDRGTVQWLAREMAAQVLELDDIRRHKEEEIDAGERVRPEALEAQIANEPQKSSIPVWQIVGTRSLLLIAFCFWLSASWVEMARIREIDWYRQLPASFYETFSQSSYGLYRRGLPLYASIFRTIVKVLPATSKGGIFRVLSSMRYMDTSHPRFHEFVDSLRMFMSVASLLACVRVLERLFTSAFSSLRLEAACNSVKPVVGSIVGVMIAWYISGSAVVFVEVAMSALVFTFATLSVRHGKDHRVRSKGKQPEIITWRAYALAWLLHLAIIGGHELWTTRLVETEFAHRIFAFTAPMWGGVVPRHFSFMYSFRHQLLRSLSFSLELIDSVRAGRFVTRKGDNVMLFFRYVDYLFYTPLFIAGPFLEFDTFSALRYSGGTDDDADRARTGDTNWPTPLSNDTKLSLIHRWGTSWALACWQLMRSGLRDVMTSAYTKRALKLFLAILLADAALHTFYSPVIYMRMTFDSGDGPPTSMMPVRWMEVVRGSLETIANTFRSEDTRVEPGSFPSVGDDVNRNIHTVDRIAVELMWMIFTFLQSSLILQFFGLWASIDLLGMRIFRLSEGNLPGLVDDCPDLVRSTTSLRHYWSRFHISWYQFFMKRVYAPICDTSRTRRDRFSAALRSPFVATCVTMLFSALLHGISNGNWLFFAAFNIIGTTAERAMLRYSSIYRSRSRAVLVVNQMFIVVMLGCMSGTVRRVDPVGLSLALVGMVAPLLYFSQLAAGIETGDGRAMLRTAGVSSSGKSKKAS